RGRNVTGVQTCALPILVGTAWTFKFPWGFFGVIWALGASMVILAAVVRLPMKWITILSAGVIVFHDLADKIRPAQFGSWAWVWRSEERRVGKEWRVGGG